jgi:hypothetical protein
MLTVFGIATDVFARTRLIPADAAKANVIALANDIRFFDFELMCPSLQVTLQKNHSCIAF